MDDKLIESILIGCNKEVNELWLKANAEQKARIKEMNYNAESMLSAKRERLINAIKEIVDD